MEAAGQAPDPAAAALSAADAARRWRGMASRLVGLAPVGRVYIRAKRTHERLRVVREALIAADSWAKGAAAPGRAWAAHGAATAEIDAAVALCGDSADRNTRRVVAARDALLRDRQQAHPQFLEPTSGARAWPPEVCDSAAAEAGAFVEFSWMEDTGGCCPTAGVALDRVLREVGADRLAAAVAGAEAGSAADALAAVKLEMVREGREQLLSRRLCAWAAMATESLAKTKIYSASGSLVGGMDYSASGLALPPQLQNVVNRGYALAFQETDVNVNPLKHLGKLSGELLAVPLPGEKKIQNLFTRMWKSQARPSLALTFLDVAAKSLDDSQTVLYSQRQSGIAAAVVHRMLLASERDRRLEVLRRALADGASWEDDVLKQRKRVVKQQSVGIQNQKTRRKKARDKARMNAIAQAEDNREDDPKDEGESVDPAETGAIERWAEWLQEKASLKTKETLVEDTASLRGSYLLYLYGGSDAMPEFFSGDKVYVFHPFGKIETVTGMKEVTQKGGVKVPERTSRTSPVARDVQAEVLGWSDCLFERKVAHSPDDYATKTRDVSKFEYLVQFQQISTERTDKSKEKEKIIANNWHYAVVLQSSMRLQDATLATSRSFAHFVSSTLRGDGAARPGAGVKRAFSVQGFQGVFARDVFAWLKDALRLQEADVVKTLLTVRLIDEEAGRDGEGERLRAVRTELVGNALRYALRLEEESVIYEAKSAGITCMHMVLAVEGAVSYVRVADLRATLENVWKVSSEVNRAAMTGIFEALVEVFSDGAALEAWASTGARPFVADVFGRAGLNGAVRRRLVVAVASRLAALGRGGAVPSGERPAPHGLSPWHAILARCDESLVSAVATPPGPAPTDDYGRTPLSVVVQLARPPKVVQAVARCATAAHLAAPDAFGCAPLHYAAQAGSVATCGALLDLLAARGAARAVDAENFAGETPLRSAVASPSPKRVAVCALLLERGAALGPAAAFELLAVPEHAALPGFDAVAPRLAAAAAAGGLPLHALVAADRVGECRAPRAASPEALVRAHQHARDVLADGAGGPDLGATPLHVARSRDAAALLLDADPDAWRRRTARGDTPLHRACARGDVGAVEELLRRGARWGRAFLNRRGESPYETATSDAKKLIRAAITSRRDAQSAKAMESVTRRAPKDWRAEARRIDDAVKLAKVAERVAELKPAAGPAEVDAPARGAAPGRTDPGRTDGAAAFEPEIPALLAPEALTQLFQLDGESRRRALDVVLRVATEAVAPGATRVGGAAPRLFRCDGVLFERAFDYVGGELAHRRVLRVYALDERDPATLTALAARIAQLHRKGRASPLAYELERAPGAGELYYKLPDPVSVTGVCKFFRLTTALASIAASHGFLGPPRGVQSSFELDHDEQAHVEAWASDPSPTLLLGRGGTGKTLIILQSLWGAYRRAVAAGDGGVVVFATGSNVLRASVREAFLSLRHAYLGLPATGDDAPPASLRAADLPPDDGLPRVLFLTTRELLAAVDASCARPLLGARPGGAVADVASLEASLREHESSSRDARGAEPAARRGSRGFGFAAGDAASREVTTDAFLRWWQPSAAVRADPGVVWSEILTHVKGAPRVSALGKPLTRDEYLALPRKTAPAFAGLASAGHERWGDRDAVYDIFENYERDKNECGGYDICDLVSSCMTQVLGRGGAYEGVELAGLMLDEVQDFTLSTVVLLLQLLEDEDRLLVGGDTAQTICKVTFSFTDLRATLHRRRDRAERRLREHWAAPRDARPPVAPRVPRPAELKVLTTNYRCHQGVLAVANLCLEMMALFPNSVDVVAPERAHFAGELPLLFTDDAFDDVAEVFSGGNAVTEMGANQVIIVRNDAAKRELPAELAGALVMTPLEAKGLEFTDVFVWNFFSDSVAADRGWGAVARACGVELGDRVAEAFDARVHLALSDELKQLYVAVTRARERLVFFDQSPRARDAFFRALLDRRVARAHDGVFSKTGGALALARASEAREWRARGATFLRRGDAGDFTRAADCFAKSGDEPRRLLCVGQDALAAARRAAGAEAEGLALDAAYLLARSECEGSEVPLAAALEAAGAPGLAADAWRRLGRDADAFRASRDHLRRTDKAAYDAAVEDARRAKEAADAALAAAREAAAARPPAARPAARTAAAPRRARELARRLLDEKMAAAAAPRAPADASAAAKSMFRGCEHFDRDLGGWDASSEAAAPPSVVSTAASHATSTATSQIAVAPSRHAGERMVERTISLRELQEAKKHGAPRRGDRGRARYEYRGLVYVEAPGATGVTAFYTKAIPHGCLERAFVPFRGKRAPAREVERVEQAILRDRGVETKISDHAERGHFGYLVASASVEATDEAAHMLRGLLAEHNAEPNGLPTVREDVYEESFPSLPSPPKPNAATLRLEEQLRSMEKRLAEAEAARSSLQQELGGRLTASALGAARAEEKLAASETARLSLQRELDESKAALQAARADAASQKQELDQLKATLATESKAALRAARAEAKSQKQELDQLKATLATLASVVEPPEPVRRREPRDSESSASNFLEDAGLSHRRDAFADADALEMDVIKLLQEGDLEDLGLDEDERARFFAARNHFGVAPAPRSPKGKPNGGRGRGGRGRGRRGGKGKGGRGRGRA